MQSFPYQDRQHSPFLLDSVKEDPPFMEDGSVDNNHSFSLFYPTPGEISASGQNVAVFTMKQTDDSSANQVSSDKRKSPDSSSLYSAHEDKKPKKYPLKNEEKKGKAEQKKDRDPPKGYIHVRARRGQATDSHSLAERVRREKISERMKLLQSLVPGCDKVTGKALMLDEIINYVQSLQNQVEFLSMKLASVNPMFYGYGFDVDAFMQCSSSHTAAFMDTTSTYPLVDPSTALLLQQGQRSSMFPQDNASVFWDVDDPRHKLYHHSGFTNNLCSYN